MEFAIVVGKKITILQNKAVMLQLAYMDLMIVRRYGRFAVIVMRHWGLRGAVARLSVPITPSARHS